MDTNTLKDFISLILDRTGIAIRTQETSELQRKLQSRMSKLGLTSAQYYQLLYNDSGLKNTRNAQEWNTLASLITTGESFFFRDEGQMQLLREFIFPQIIRSRYEQKVINILSAGCSTGEEVYSLAIILRELIPDFADWETNLIGIDLNQEAIEKARLGIYQDWSFRGVEAPLRSRYFRPTVLGWEVLPSLKRGISFYTANLISDVITFASYQSVDLIVCRNVFIYFDPQKIAIVLHQFINLLKPGGYLLTGHTELQNQVITPLRPLYFIDSLVYELPHPDRSIETSSQGRKVTPQKTNISPAWFALTKRAKNSTATLQKSGSNSAKIHDILEVAQAAFRENQYSQVTRLLEEELKTWKYNEKAMELMAHAYANQGNYDRAIAVCESILAKNPTSYVALSLLAKVAEERGNTAQAKDYLCKLVSFHSHFVAAYLELAVLHLKDGEKKQADSLLQMVTQFLADFEEDEILPYTENVTISTVRQYLDQLELALENDQDVGTKFMCPIPLL